MLTPSLDPVEVSGFHNVSAYADYTWMRAAYEKPNNIVHFYYGTKSGSEFGSYPQFYVFPKAKDESVNSSY